MSYTTWLDGYRRDVAAEAMPGRILLALTMRGTMYAGAPTGGVYKIRKVEPPKLREGRETLLEGEMTALDSLPAGGDLPADILSLVSRGGVWYRRVPGCFGMPVLGKPMFVGEIDGRNIVSSPVRWIRALHATRRGFLDAILDAYRRGDPVWLDYVEQAMQPMERSAA